MSKSLIAGGILLIGLNLLFGRRGGNVLIHLSIGLLMLGQFIFGDRQIEERITLADGEKTSMALRLDEVELAFVDDSASDKNRVIAVDQEELLRAMRTGRRIADPNLPFQIAVSQYLPNADVVSAQRDEAPQSNPANEGIGLEFRVVPAEKTGGAKEGTNMPAAYIELFDKSGKQSLGKRLVALQLNDFSQLTRGRQDNFVDRVRDGDKTYAMGLRFRRTYKDYEILLKDVQRINYSGTETPRDYSSRNRLQSRWFGVVGRSHLDEQSDAISRRNVLSKRFFSSGKSQARTQPDSRSSETPDGLCRISLAHSPLWECSVTSAARSLDLLHVSIASALKRRR